MLFERSYSNTSTTHWAKNLKRRKIKSSTAMDSRRMWTPSQSLGNNSGFTICLQFAPTVYELTRCWATAVDDDSAEVHRVQIPDHDRHCQFFCRSDVRRRSQ